MAIERRHPWTLDSRTRVARLFAFSRPVMATLVAAGHSAAPFHVICAHLPDNHVLRTAPVRCTMDPGWLNLHRDGSMNDVTRILSSIEHGDRATAEQLLPLVYDELRKLAAVRISHESPDHT